MNCYMSILCNNLILSLIQKHNQKITLTAVGRSWRVPLSNPLFCRNSSIQLLYFIWSILRRNIIILFFQNLLNSFNIITY